MQQPDAASYDKPALPHFTGRGDLEASRAILESDSTLLRYTPEGYAQLKAVCKTLATADTPPEEMR